MAISVADRRSTGTRLTWVEVVLALTVVVFVVLGVARLLYPYDIGEYEANAWAPALLLAHLHNPYTASLALHPPYLASAYGPLYYLIVGIGIRAFGLQFWLFRLISIASGLGAAAFIFRIARRLTGNRTPAQLAAAAFLAQWPVMAWDGVQRPDMLALALVLAGLDLMLRPRDELRRWHAVSAAAALVAALFTRQTYVIPPLFAVAWFITIGKRRDLAWFVLTFLCVGGGLFALLDLTSHGGLLTSLFTNQSGAASSIGQLRSNLESVLESPASWAVALAAPLSCALAVRRYAVVQRELARASLLLVAYAALAAVLAAVTSARAGANMNYWIEPLAIGALLSGLGSELIPPARRGALAAVATVLVACAMLEAGLRQGHGAILLWRSKPYYDAVVSDLRRIPASSGPMFSSYPELVDDAGRTDWVNDWVQYDGRAPRLEQALSHLLHSRKLSAIVWPASPAPPGYVQVGMTVPRPQGVYLVNVYLRRALEGRLSH